jgi:hypothetical protein
MPQSQPKPETETPGFGYAPLVNRLTEDSQRRGLVGRIAGRFDAASLTGRQQGHFVTGRCLVRLADDFRPSELDAGEKLLERAFRHVMAAMLASTLPQRLIENDIRFACRAEFKRGIEHWVTPLLRVNDTFRAGLDK